MSAPVITDVTGATGSNTADTSPDVTYQAHSTGDLMIQVLCSDGADTHTPPAAGPNSETIVTIRLNNIGGDAGSVNDCVVSAVYWISTGDEIAGSLAWAIGGSGQEWTGRTIRVPTGEFDAANPIDAVSAAGNGNGGDATMPAFSAVQGGGRVVAVGAVDVDPMAATFSPTGWTDLWDQDIGAVGGFAGTRDADTTASESIGTANFNIGGDGDDWACFGFIVNGPAAGVTSADGSASGTAAASAVGISDVTANGSAVGTATASATGISSQSADGSAAGVGAATATGAATVVAVASAAGQAAADATGFGLTSSVASAAGTAAATATGESAVSADASSAGVATADATGTSAVVGTWSSTGTATVSATGLSDAVGVGNAAGVATADAVGSDLGAEVSADATAAGVATASGVGQSVVTAMAACVASSSAAAVGESETEGIGNAAGSADGVAEGTGGVAVGGETSSWIWRRRREEMIDRRSA